MIKSVSSLLRISPIVESALKYGRPVVALESTIISHGMPYPQNKLCAISIEQQIRKNGAIPATVAIFNGIIHVGLDEQMIENLAKAGKSVMKVSRRDLPLVVSKCQMGATTVAATMICSHLAGIEIFVTGGIGGVHRGYEHTLDVSADLKELGKTPVTVVSAGVKSILDIPRTLEYLETEGVPVVTYKSAFFPAFFSASSGLPSPITLNTPVEIAELIEAKRQLKLQNGMVVAVPSDETLQGDRIEKAIKQALDEADKNKISGAKITPFLLERVNQLTDGASLHVNIALIHKNAKVGAQIACELSKLRSKQSKISLGRISNNQNGKLIVIGGAAIDYQYRSSAKQFQPYKSCPATSKKSLGGVARNIAEAGARLDSQCVLLTALGDDEDSKIIKRQCQKLEIRVEEIKGVGQTAKYLAILNKNNDQFLGISDMQINQSLTFDRIYETFFKKELSNINKKDIVIIDANVGDQLDDLLKLLQFCRQKGYYTIFECKGQKSSRIADDRLLKLVSLLKMNITEENVINKVRAQKGQNSNLVQSIGIQKQWRFTDVKAIVTNGPQPLRLLSPKLEILVPVYPLTQIKKTTGAGDTMTGALASLLLKGFSFQKSLELSLIASSMTLEHDGGKSSISPALNLKELEARWKLWKGKSIQ